MGFMHDLYLAIIRTGKSAIAIAVDLLAVAGAIWIGWALVPYLVPYLARWCPFLIC